MPIRLITYNLQFSLNEVKIIENIVKGSTEVDIFCLQEVTHYPNKGLILDRIQKRLGNEWEIKSHLRKQSSDISFGVAIIWNKNKLKAENVTKINLPNVLELSFMKKALLKILGVNPNPFSRGALNILFKFESNLFSVSCMHLDNLGGFMQRKKEIKIVLNNLKKYQIKRNILCGDFNTLDIFDRKNEEKKLSKILINFSNASSKINSTIDSYFMDASSKRNNFLIKTFNIHIKQKLDQVWVRNLKIRKCHKLKWKGSDHQPIYIECELTRTNFRFK